MSTAFQYLMQESFNKVIADMEQERKAEAEKKRVVDAAFSSLSEFNKAHQVLGELYDAGFLRMPDGKMMKDLNQTIIKNFGMAPMMNTAGAIQRYQGGGTVSDVNPNLNEALVRNKDGFTCPFDAWDKRVAELIADGKLLKP